MILGHVVYVGSLLGDYLIPPKGILICLCLCGHGHLYTDFRLQSRILILFQLNTNSSMSGITETEYYGIIEEYSRGR